MNFILKNRIVLIGMALGAIGGYLYYHFYGCMGSCTITSSPVNSTLYGTMIGGLVFSIFKKTNPIKKVENPKDECEKGTDATDF